MRNAHTPPVGTVVLIDADKQRSVQYYEHVLSHGLLSPHGLMMHTSVQDGGRYGLEQHALNDHRTCQVVVALECQLCIMQLQ